MSNEVLFHHANIHLQFAKENTWKKYVEGNMNRDPWSITYRIVANKLKTGNIMSTIKKADGSMTAGWQERGCRGGERNKRIHLLKLKPNKAPDLDGIKAEIY